MSMHLFMAIVVERFQISELLADILQLDCEGIATKLILCVPSTVCSPAREDGLLYRFQ